MPRLHPSGDVQELNVRHTSPLFSFVVQRSDALGVYRFAAVALYVTACVKTPAHQADSRLKRWRERDPGN
jgi:hypothetical protein